MNNDYSDDSDKTWRFNAVLPDFPTPNLHWSNPVLIYTGSVLVGAATLSLEAGAVVARASVMYSIPERLSAETGQSYYLLPRVRVDLAPFDETLVLALELRPDCGDANVAPVRGLDENLD